MSPVWPPLAHCAAAWKSLRYQCATGLSCNGDGAASSGSLEGRHEGLIFAYLNLDGVYTWTSFGEHCRFNYLGEIVERLDRV